MILVYCPCKDEEEAKKIAKHLVESKLAACVNIYPAKSIYEWKGKLEDTNESTMIVKTTEENYYKVEQEIKKMHSYELPAIIKIKASASDEFTKWVNGCCKK